MIFKSKIIKSIYIFFVFFNIILFANSENEYLYNNAKILKKAKLNSKITGTYEKDKYNVLKIIELNDNKIWFDITLYNSRNGNLGDLQGIVDIKDRIIYQKTITEYGICKFEMKIKKDKIEIETLSYGNENKYGFECGYGHNVSNDGVYWLKSNKMPNIE
ncbi:hypothetical protein [Oceanivirga salmonicida]|uniref:hypothetical protein n=1 Tax=Oceanivirga salmonicida TaxID=1769291 RepID=UPI000832AE2A|nr:hypothetical protein [Oceanivirga salmonicida]